MQDVRPPGADEHAFRAGWITRLRRCALSFAAAIAIATFLWGCATETPTLPPAAPSEVSSQPGNSKLVHDLTQKVAERDRALDSLQTEAIMEYSAPDKHPPRVREQITARRPDSLRVEAMSALSVALILVTNGKQLTIFQPSDNKLVYAPATAATLNQFIQIPMQPADAVTLLLGIAPDSSALAQRAPDSIASEGEMTVAQWSGPKSTRRELGFKDDQLAMVRLRATTGAVEYEVRYSDYHDIGGLMFPYSVDATFPVAQSRVVVRYKRPIINGDIPVSAFILSPPSGARQAAANDAAQ